MAERPEPYVLEAFAAETRRSVARRVPIGVWFFVGVVVVAGGIELAYFPNRVVGLITSFGAEMLLCAIALSARRSERLRPWIIPITVTTTLGIGACMTIYVTATGASGDALALALIVFLTGVALLYPWGAWGQVPLAVGVIGVYGAALASGVRGDLPIPYGLLAVLGGAVTSVVGAVFLHLHRRAIFLQRLLLERSRDEQLATLNEVTSTVTATLELGQVLRLVCEGTLRVLGLERLWLFWRETMDGGLRGVEARPDGDQARLTELSGDTERWESLLQLGSDPKPGLLEAGPEVIRALGTSSRPSHLLRLPLEFRSEIVGVILADWDPSEARTAHLLDFGATLGNGAAMAIANARLYALVLQHRAELQRLGNKRLDLVEEGMRRISHDLHDGTCQALMAINLDLTLLDRKLGGRTELRGAVQAVRTQIVDVMHSVRQMSHLIHPPVLDDFGAVAAIDAVAVKYREASDLDVWVESGDAGVRFAPAVELLLFRIFQEALTNAVKHAGAKRVTVRIEREEGAVVLEIADDGRGFDSQAYFRAPPASAGLGLIGMRERVAHFGGALQITSRTGSGTRIVVRVPAEERVRRRVAAVG